MASMDVVGMETTSADVTMGPATGGERS